MSKFDEQLEQALEEQKKKKKKNIPIGTPSLNRFSYLPSYDDDIAPVRATTMIDDAEEDEEDEGFLDFFQKGAFEDGFEWSDIPKAILGTVGDAGLNIVKGAAGLGEGLVDLAGYGVAGVAEFTDRFTGNGVGERFADDLRDKLSVNYIDKKLKPAEDYLDQYSVLGRTSDSITQGIGQVGTILLTGGIAAGAGVSATAATTGVMGLSGMGSGMGQAYQSGATDGEATAYGAISGAADALTELMFGGLGKAVKGVGLSHGIGGIDDMLAKKVSTMFSSQLLKNAAEFGVKASGEGIEEVVAGVAQAIGKKLTYMDEKELGDLLKDENLLEQFVVGAVTSGITQAPSVVQSTKSGTDFISGLNQDEQAVVKKEIENRIVEQEKGGKKLTKQEKAAIEEQVARDLDKGHISTDLIDEIVGGDTYKAYKDSVKNRDAVLAEFEELGKTQNATLAQQSRYRELETRVKDIQGSDLWDKRKAEVDGIIAKRVNGTRLAESYNERARRGQVFTADVTKYDEKQRETVQRAIDSGVMNNTNRAHELVDTMAKISADKGVTFDFTNTAKMREAGMVEEGVVKNGYITSDGKITINVDSAKALQSIAGHEVTHALEQSEHYQELQNAVFTYAQYKGDYNSRLKSITDLYAKYDPDADPKKELTADLVGDYLFTDEQFVNKLAVENRNLFQKIWDEVKYLWKVATAGSKEARQLEKVKRAFEKAYKDGGKAQAEGTKYSLATVEAVQPKSDKWSRTHDTAEAMAKFPNMWNVAADESEARNPTQITSTVKSYRKIYNYLQSEGFNGTILDASSGLGYGTKAGVEEYGFNVEDIEPYPDKSYSPKYTDYSKLDKKYDVIISNAVLNVLPQDQRDALAVKMGELLNDGGRLFVNVRGKDVESLAKTGKNIHLGNMEWIETVKGSYQKGFTKPELVAYLEDALGDGFTVKPTSMFGAVSAVVTKDGGVKYSLSTDSDGRQLTAEQREYFKDSKVVDENGNLKVMYHGTSAGGHTVFDPYGKARYGLFGAGSYFTDNKSVGESYTNKGKGKAPQVYETYLNITNPIDMDAPADAEAWAKAMPDVRFPEVGTNEAFYRAMEEYFEDMEYSRWEAAESAMEVIEGMGYDGITHIGGGRFNKADPTRHRVYIAFQPEQIKNVDNTKPTDNPDIRYSLSTDNEGKQLTKEQAEYFKDSKMRDRRGNLKVMYHGTTNGGFHTFDNRYSDDGASFFFVDDNLVASTYSGTRETYAAQAFNSVEDLNNFFKRIGKAEYFVDEKDGEYRLRQDEISSYYTVAESDSLDDLYNEFCDYEGVGYGDVNYKVYLNLVNPFIFDAKGAEWNGLPNITGDDAKYEYIKLVSVNDDNTVTIEYTLTGDHAPVTKDVVLFDGFEFDDGVSETLANMEPDEIIENVPAHPSTTREYAEYARKNGYDGVIFENINDNGGYGHYGTATVAIAFDSNQIKSVANTSPTADSDIRYSLSDAPINEVTEDGLTMTYVRVPNQNTPNYGSTYGQNIEPAGEYMSMDTMQGKNKIDGYEYGTIQFKKPLVIEHINTSDTGWKKTVSDMYGGLTGKKLTAALIKDGYDAIVTYDDYGYSEIVNLNGKKLSGDGVRFSLSAEVEETDRLVAIHNKSASGVMRMLERGGVPFPSIAIKKAGTPHEGFGEYSILFPREAIDPAESRWNKLYSNDAWSPTEPRTEYDVGNTTKYMKLFENMVGSDVFHALKGSGKLDSDELERRLRDNSGDIFEAVKNFEIVKYGYLQSIGQRPEVTKKPKRLDGFNRYTNEQLLAIFEQIDGETIRNATYDSAEVKQQIAKVLDDHFMQQLGDDEEMIRAFRAAPAYKAEDVNVYAIQDAYRQWERNGRAIPTEVSPHELTKVLRTYNVEESDDYRRWVEGVFDGLIKDSGIPNGKDMFTPSGNRRSFKALHVPATLDNIVKQMRKEQETGVGTFGINLRGAATKTYSTVEEMRADRGRLLNEHIDDAEYDSYMKGFYARLGDLTATAAKKKNDWQYRDAAEEILLEAVRDAKTKATMTSKLRKNSQYINFSEELADDLWALKMDVQNMPTPYFESKARRIVYTEEAAAFIIPDNAPAKLVNELNRRGLAYKTYEAGNEADRLAKLNSVLDEQPDLRFSLSAEGEQPKTYGSYNIFGRDVAYAPVSEDVQQPAAEESSVAAPVDESAVAVDEAVDEAVETTPVEELFPDDMAPVSEEYEADRMDSLFYEDAPPEMDAPYYEDEPVEPMDDPFYDRDIYEIGNRKIKAYQYENPEVRPFFRKAAEAMLGDLRDTVKGEKWFNSHIYYESGGEEGFGGTKRQTAPDIAELLDKFGYTYAQIEKGLNDIIEDNGKENNAVAKRIEFMLNDRLLYGYKDVWERDMPPDAGYIQLVNEKSITEYSKEAFAALDDRYAPPVEEDIAPVAAEHAPEKHTVSVAVSAQRPIATLVEEIAPVAEEYEAITPEKPKKKKRGDKLVMAAAVEQEDQQIAKILDAEPTPANRKSRAWARFKAAVFDKGAVFEDLALKTRNRTLMGKWNYIIGSEARAQRLMGSGNDKVKSLNSIREKVETSGKVKEFSEYLYHKHNVDRMSLEDRYEETPNKPVFGWSVTSEVSQEIVDEYEKTHPQFIEYAQDVYDYMNYLRSMMVENGVISQDTADLWAEMYPHYVPIRRAVDKGLAINVPLDTGRTGVNAPVKRATGGSSDILPLFDTMAMRTLQTYRAVARNSFGVELKNTLHPEAAIEETSLDEVIDSIDDQEGLLQAAKNGMPPTFTVFENGEKVTYDITEDMYDALKPVSEFFSGTSKVLNTISNFRRGVLTEFNPVFMLTNAIKDVQDIVINSQHPVRTYAKIPEAAKQMKSKGYWYKEYMENGGEQNTYFDRETNTFDAKRKGVAKLLDIPPLSTISKLNNIIEMTPRLAEYIASREAGRSVEVSMLDAARVTTNFAAGGDVTKWLNRNGATFLNASVQGLMQNVRNFREAQANGLKGWANLATKFAVAGLPAVLLNGLLWGDDDEYEELSDYVKQSYYIVWKTEDGKFIRIPKGRTLAVIQNAFEQMGNLITGDDEADLGAFLELVVSNLAPNNPIEENILSPIIQVANNETWYGEDLVPTRLQKLPAAEQFDESTDAFSRWLGEKLNVSPVKINYLLDQYSGGVGDTFLPMMTPEAESGDNSFVGNMLAPLKSKFTADAVMNNQNVSDFYELKDELSVNANAGGATDEDVLKYKYMNSVSAEMSELYAQKREIQSSDLPDDKKYEQVREVQRQIGELAKNALDTYNRISISGEYATVGDRYFNADESGEWKKLTDEQVTKYEATRAAGDSPYASDGTNHYRMTDDGWRKITDDQLKKQNEVTSGLGISAEDYWSNKEEYDYAYEHPENYAVAKAVGGYEAYKAYSGELYDIKADKDEYGKSISGSRKEKVLEYINNLDADYYTKIILWKNEYNSDDTYNYEIIEYLDSRSDISYEEELSILRKLGFMVDAEGNVSWD